jgi:hypothetical protein
MWCAEDETNSRPHLYFSCINTQVSFAMQFFARKKNNLPKNYFLTKKRKIIFLEKWKDMKKGK